MAKSDDGNERMRADAVSYVGKFRGNRNDIMCSDFDV